MEHSDAIRLRAAEKYVLGELSSQLRDEYEDHYFACQECAMELKATVAFVDGSRTALCAEHLVVSRKPETIPAVGGWFGWLRPVFAVPIFAALLLVLGYENLVTIPRLRSESATEIVRQNADLVSLIGMNSRGDDAKALQIHGTKPTILEVDIPPTSEPPMSEFSGYLCRLQDEAGRSIYEYRVSASEAKNTVHLVVSPGKLETQKYSLVIFGEGPANPQVPSQKEIERIAFTIEIVR
jgi:hypothetical protein